jgi:hypothetical protein
VSEPTLQTAFVGNIASADIFPYFLSRDCLGCDSVYCGRMPTVSEVHAASICRMNLSMDL